MARIPYVGDDSDDPLVKIYFEGAQQLGGRIANANRIYANAPRLALFFLPFNMALQREGGGGLLDGATKELAVVATSMANQCAYCTAHNASLGLATGLTELQLADISTGTFTTSEHLSDKQRAVVRWAFAIADNSAIRDDDAWEAIKRHFSDVEALELTWLCAFFNMNNRVHDALRLDIEEQSEVDKIKKSKYVPYRSILAFVRRMVDVAEASLEAEEAESRPVSVEAS